MTNTINCRIQLLLNIDVILPDYCKAALRSVQIVGQLTAVLKYLQGVAYVLSIKQYGIISIFFTTATACNEFIFSYDRSQILKLLKALARLLKLSCLLGIPTFCAAKPFTTISMLQLIFLNHSLQNSY